MVALGRLFAAPATFVVPRSEGQTSSRQAQPQAPAQPLSTAEAVPVSAWRRRPLYCDGGTTCSKLDARAISTARIAPPSSACARPSPTRWRFPLAHMEGTESDPLMALWVHGRHALRTCSGHPARQSPVRLGRGD